MNYIVPKNKFPCCAKTRLLQLFDYSNVPVQTSTMKKYICILAGAALLAACEQKTETTEPAATPAPTSPPAATASSPAAPRVPPPHKPNAPPPHQRKQVPPQQRKQVPLQQRNLLLQQPNRLLE